MKIMKIVLYYFIGPFTALAVVVGCATWRSDLPRVVQDVQILTDTAMIGWNVYAASGKADTNQVARVKAAYAKYRAAMDVVNAGINGAVASTNKTGLLIALDAAKASQTNLLAAIYQFTNK